MDSYQNPVPTVDLVILCLCDSWSAQRNIVLIKRRNPPYGWALPGGFVNVGESFEEAAIREGKEETCLDLELLYQFYTYSHPSRDPRRRSATTVFVAKPKIFGQLAQAADDAQDLIMIPLHDALKLDLAFDHKDILQDVERSLDDGVLPNPNRFVMK